MQGIDSSNKSCVVRSGRVLSLDSEQIGVEIVQVSACASCHAKGMCTSLDQSSKTIYVPYVGQNIKIGDSVNISMHESLGLDAVLVAYILPITLMLIALIVLTSLGMDQLMAAFMSLSTLVAYFGILFALRDKLKKKFTFFIEKINE